MNREEQLKIVKEMQEVVEQMRLDDLESDPKLAQCFFSCDCCGKNSSLAGSVLYSNFRLCNDCVLKAEIGFALNKFSSIENLIDAMEDLRLKEICDFIKQNEKQQKN